MNLAESGLFPDQVTINVEKKDIKTHAGEIPIETRLIFEGILDSDVYKKLYLDRIKTMKVLKN
jgi:hypothetical protein